MADIYHCPTCGTQLHDNNYCPACHTTMRPQETSHDHA